MADIPKNMDSQFNYEGIHVLKGGIVEHSLDIDWRIMNIVNMDVPARQLFCLLCRGLCCWSLSSGTPTFSWGRNQIHPRKKWT